MDPSLDFRFIQAVRMIAELPVGVLGWTDRNRPEFDSGASFEAYVNHCEMMIEAASRGNVGDVPDDSAGLLHVAGGQVEVVRGLQARLHALAGCGDEPVLQEMAAQILAGQVDPAAALEFSDYSARIAEGFEKFTAWYADIPERERDEIEARIFERLAGNVVDPAWRTSSRSQP